MKQSAPTGTVGVDGPDGKKSGPLEHSRGSHPLIDALVLTLGAILVPLLVLLDATVLSAHMSEKSLTELAQATLIALAAILFFRGVQHHPEAAGYLMMEAIFFTCMFIRENDAFLDQIWQGFWSVPVALILMGGGFYLTRHRDSIGAPFWQHAITREAAIILVGLVIVLIYSRLFGSGYLWREVMGPNYTWQIKAALQEGVELMGYVLIGYGAFLSSRTGFGQRTPKAT